MLHRARRTRHTHGLASGLGCARFSSDLKGPLSCLGEAQTLDVESPTSAAPCASGCWLTAATSSIAHPSRAISAEADLVNDARSSTPLDERDKLEAFESTFATTPGERGVGSSTSQLLLPRAELAKLVALRVPDERWPSCGRRSERVLVAARECRSLPKYRAMKA